MSPAGLIVTLVVMIVGGLSYGVQLLGRWLSSWERPWWRGGKRFYG